MSGSEALPALETTRFEGGTTGSSLHAMTEAVAALPTSNLWLVSPFHGLRFFEGWKRSTGYEVCRSYVKVRSLAETVPTVSPDGSGPRRIRMGREKNPCVIRWIRDPKSAWQSMEKPYTTWGFLVDRFTPSHPHR